MAASPGVEVATPSTSGSREAIAPTDCRWGDFRPLFISPTRSCQAASPAGARQVSTLTSATSSDWLSRVVRSMPRPPAAQRARVSQLDSRPPEVRPRTSTWTHERPGVRACHEATSSVRSKPGSRHGEVQRPTR